MIKNLLEETIEVLKYKGKSPEEVLWVGDAKISFSWKEFSEKARLITYDNGFGVQEIRDLLMVVGDNWWLERYEYDGSEFWIFKTYPHRPESGKPSAEYLTSQSEKYPGLYPKFFYPGPLVE
jgi:hypothetical protein